MANVAFPNDRKLHIVMFPWLAFGHISPFFELSKFIAQKGHQISFISTPRNIDRLPKIPQDLASYITLVKIPLPKIEGLPENTEATMDVKSAVEVDYLKKAYNGMEPELTRFLENSCANFIIHDFAAPWIHPIAANLGIPRFFFWIFNAWYLALFGSAESLINGLKDRSLPEDLTVPPPWVKFETKVVYKNYDAKSIQYVAANDASGFSDAYRVGTALAGCNAIILRHCNEFEPEWLNVLKELHQKDVIPLGLMPPKLEDKGDESESWILIKKWLDAHSKRSILYVALGSEATLNQDQLDELAHGLELSKVPFFWALRQPLGLREVGLIDLPNGFEDRVKGRGLVWKSWGPQLKILDHDSVGGFLTHCGWSSIVEGLVFGRALVCLPFWGDQGLNARLLADKQVGFEVPRNDEDGSFTRDSVAQSVRIVMVEEDGQIFRDKAKEASSMFGDRELHDRYPDNFIEYLEHKKGSNSNYVKVVSL